MAVLNMASSSSPGGGFRFGAGAQDFWVPGAFLEVIEVVRRFWSCAMSLRLGLNAQKHKAVAVDGLTILPTLSFRNSVGVFPSIRYAHHKPVNVENSCSWRARRRICIAEATSTASLSHTREVPWQLKAANPNRCIFAKKPAAECKSTLCTHALWSEP